MAHDRSIEADYFESMYRQSSDPWGFETSAYEQAKYRHTIAALDGRVYHHGFEIGCANGVLTAMLAEHCDQLLAVDVSETALTAARARCLATPSIRFDRMAFPIERPGAGLFDLVILSEVAYYWDDKDLDSAIGWLRENVAAGGDILLVHWTGATDYPQSGDQAVAKLFYGLRGRVHAVAEDRQPDYRLDLWRTRA